MEKTSFFLIDFLGKQYKISNKQDIFYYPATKDTFEIGKTIFPTNILITGTKDKSFIGKNKLSDAYLSITPIEFHKAKKFSKLEKKNHATKKLFSNEGWYLFQVKQCFFLNKRSGG